MKSGKSWIVFREVVKKNYGHADRKGGASLGRGIICLLLDFTMLMCLCYKDYDVFEEEYMFRSCILCLL